MRYLKITNRSAWPTPAVNVLVRWVCKRESLGTNAHHYSVLLKSCRIGSWCGMGGKHDQWIKLDRRYATRKDGWPFSIKDSRHSGHVTHVLKSRMELLVYLLAHEAHHATDGHPKGYRKFRTDGRVDHTMMEWDCNLAGMRAVEALREEWPKLFVAIMAAMRLERSKKSKSVSLRRDPSPKLQRAEDALLRWERKAKLAKTKIAKYARQVKYYTEKKAAMVGK